MIIKIPHHNLHRKYYTSFSRLNYFNQVTKKSISIRITLFFIGSDINEGKKESFIILR